MGWSKLSTTRRSRILAALIGLALALVGISTVWAAIWVEFHPSSAPPGATVEVRGYGFPPSSPLAVFLAPKDVVDAITSSEDSRLISIGVMTANQTGEGRMRFVVPDLSPGTYQGLIHCEPCARYSFGRTMAPGEYFSITPTLLPESGKDPASSELKGIFAALVGLLLVAAGLWIKFGAIRIAKQ